KAERSRCQGRSFGERRRSLMIVLLALRGRQEPGEELTPQVAELPLPVDRQAGPDRRRGRRRRAGGGRQRRGGAIGRGVVSMMSLRVVQSAGDGTTRPAQAARRRRL